MGTTFDDMTVEEMLRLKARGISALISNGHVVGFDIEGFEGEETEK
jgi:hypothetical protein